MDKVNNTSRQAMPLWERQNQSRGHKSAVDGALKAHRQRSMEREARVQERLNMVKNIQSQFFPTSNVSQRPELQNNPIQSLPNQNPPLNNAPLEIAEFQQEAPLIEEIQNFNPRQIDDMYSEAQLGSTNDSALAIVQKDIANPEEGPVDDVPRGSYIDYTV